MIRLIWIALTAIYLATPALSASDPATLASEALEKLDAAHLALSEADRASDRVTALSQTIQAFEEGLDALRESLRHAALHEAALRREFETESDKVSRFLGVLLSIQSSVGPLTLLHPTGPVGTARSGMIVSEITPAIQSQALEFRTRLEEVHMLRQLQENAAGTLQDGLKGVQQARTALSQAMSNRSELPQRFLSDPSKLQSLIDSAETLEGFASGLASIDVIATDETTPIEIRNFTSAQGTLALPAPGTLLRQFQEADAAGVARPGLLLATRPRALVTTPWAATIRYGGPLLDYGKVMILEPDTGVLMVLGGLEHVFGEPGQVLAANAPIGLMGGGDRDPDGFFEDAVNGVGSEASETLYIELRLGGEPVDPAGWFAQTKE